MNKVRFTPRAKAQLHAFARELEISRAGHGKTLVFEVRRVLGLVSSFPKMGLLYYRDIRRLLIRKYSCFVLYRVRPGEIVVLKVSDARREPEVIQGELGT